MRKKRRSKRNWLLDNYQQSFNYLKDSKPYIYSVIIIFLIFVLIGFFLPPPPAILNTILEFIQDLLEQTQDMGAFELIWFIFSNNIKVSLLGILLGILFGAIPIALSITNGYLLGFVSSIAVMNEGTWSLWKIFPHGIFELPAVFISLGLGLRLGLFLFFEKKKSFKTNLLNVLRIFLLIVIPLLIIAAFIEGWLVFLYR
jgi:stage II sporulation protein M